MFENDLIIKYADRGFCYALVIILLWRDKEVITGFRQTLAELKDAILRLAVKVEEKK